MNKRYFNYFLLMIFSFFFLIFSGNAKEVNVTEINDFYMAFNGKDQTIDKVILKNDISFSGTIYVNDNDMILDLNGHDINFTNASESEIVFGSNGYQKGKLTITDSSEKKKGKIISRVPINVNISKNITNDSNYGLFLDGINVKKESNLINNRYANWNTFIVLFQSIDQTITKYNINLDFKVSNCKFEFTDPDGELYDINSIYGVPWKVNDDIKKINIKGNHVHLPNINDTYNVYLSDDDKEKEAEVDELTGKYKSIYSDKEDDAYIRSEYGGNLRIFVNKDNRLNYSYGTNKNFFKIYNRTLKDLKIKDVSVSKNFSIIKSENNLIKAHDFNNEYNISLNEGLDAGTYKGVITITDEEDKTYTSNIKYVVDPLEMEFQAGDITWMYGEGHTSPSVSNFEKEDYDVYYSKNGKSWTKQEPTIPGEYKVKYHMTNKNYKANDKIVSLTIEKNDKPIIITANSKSFTYDNDYHKDTGFTVTYDGMKLKNNILPTNDKIKANISGYLKEGTAVNKIESYSLENKDYYTNISLVDGTLSIKKRDLTIETPDININYDGKSHSSNYYKANGLLYGDKLSLSIDDERIYSGTSIRKIKNVKITNNGNDVTDNYNIIKKEGNLTINPSMPEIDFNNMYVLPNTILSIEDLKNNIKGNTDNIRFSIIDGEGKDQESLDDSYHAPESGFSRIHFIIPEKDLNNDGKPEYNEYSNYFDIYVSNKTKVNISGLKDNQEFTYDGKEKTPAGDIEIDNTNINSKSLKINYYGIGNDFNHPYAPKETGKYKVTYEIDDDNYYGLKSYYFSIVKKKNTKPSLEKDSFIYTGDNIKPNVLNENGLSFGGTKEATNIGEYSIEYKLDNNNIWNDNTSSPLILKWYINKRETSPETPTLTGLKGNNLSSVSLPENYMWKEDEVLDESKTYKAYYFPDNQNEMVTEVDIQVNVQDPTNYPDKPTISVDDSYTYNGSEINANVKGYDPCTMNIDGDKEVNAGRYKITVKPFSMWSDGTSDEVITYWQIDKKEVEKPNITNTFTYDGTDKGIDVPDDVNVKGTVKAKNAGSYNATLSLDKTNYIWSDGTDDDLNINWQIDKAKLKKPKLAEDTFLYGDEVELQFTNLNDNLSLSGDSGVNAGKYNAKISIKDKDNYEWSDGTNNDLDFPWTIEKMKFNKPELEKENLYYNGEAQRPNIIALDENLIVKNYKKMTDIGTYIVTISLPDKNNLCWDDGTSDDLLLSWSISKAIVEKPTLEKFDFVFDGKDHKPSFKNLNLDYLDLSGDISKKDAGTYNIKVSLKDKDNMEFNDGSIDDLTFEWFIIKASPKYTIPNDLKGIKNQKLKEIDLPKGFTWNNEEELLKAGKNSYLATFTPDDTNNISSDQNVLIEVNAKDLFNITASLNENGTINGIGENILEGSFKEIEIIPNEGYLIDKIFINNKEVNNQNKIKLLMDENKDIRVIYKKKQIKLSVIENGNVIDKYIDYGTNQVIDLNNYDQVLVNNVDMTKDIINNKLLLNNLKEDTIVEIITKEKHEESKIKETPKEESPQTGDKIYKYIIMNIISLLVIIFLKRIKVN